jgi:hypothetical protein
VTIVSTAYQFVLCNCLVIDLSVHSKKYVETGKPLLQNAAQWSAYDSIDKSRSCRMTG